MTSDAKASSSMAHLGLNHLGKRSILSKEVAEGLRWGIMTGTIVPGTRLTEEQISQETGVSRGPVREALRDLQAEGMVTVQPYRGAVVQELSDVELREVLMPVRHIIERGALRLAIDRLSEEDLQWLEAHVEDMSSRLSSPGDADALRDLVDLDIRFHRAIVEASGLRYAIQLWSAVEPSIRWAFYRLGLRHAAATEIVAEHRTLLEALRTRDLARVYKELETHTIGIVDDLLGNASESD